MNGVGMGAGAICAGTEFAPTTSQPFKLSAMMVGEWDPGEMGLQLADHRGGSQAIIRLQGVPPTVADVAQETGLTVAQLRAYNPWIAKAMGMNAPEHVQLPRVFRVYTAGITVKPYETLHQLAYRLLQDNSGLCGDGSRTPNAAEVARTAEMIQMFNPDLNLSPHNHVPAGQVLSVDVAAIKQGAKFPDSTWDGLNKAWDAMTENFGPELVVAIRNGLIAAIGVGGLLTFLAGPGGLASIPPNFVLAMVGMGFAFTTAQAVSVLDFLWKAANGNLSNREIKDQGAKLNLADLAVTAAGTAVGAVAYTQSFSAGASTPARIPHSQRPSQTASSRGGAGSSSASASARPRVLIPEELLVRPSAETIHVWSADDVAAASRYMDDLTVYLDELTYGQSLVYSDMTSLDDALQILRWLETVPFSGPAGSPVNSIPAQARMGVQQIEALFNAYNANPSTGAMTDQYRRLLSQLENHVVTLKVSLEEVMSLHLIEDAQFAPHRVSPVQNN